MDKDGLRDVAKRLYRTGDELRGARAAWRGPTWLAEPSRSTVGCWLEAVGLANVMRNAYNAIDRLTGELYQANYDMADRLKMSADNYDAADEGIIDLIRRVGGPATITRGSTGSIRVRAEDQDWPDWLPVADGVRSDETDVSQYTWAKVKSWLAFTDPDSISDSASAYRRLCETLTGLTGQHVLHANLLAQHWEGPNAVTAVNHLRHLHQTATELQAKAWAIQRSLAWYSYVLRTFQADMPRPESSDPADVAAANWAARQRMIALNGHIQTARELMPPVITKNLPPPLGRGGPA